MFVLGSTRVKMASPSQVFCRVEDPGFTLFCQPAIHVVVYQTCVSYFYVQYNIILYGTVMRGLIRLYGVV